jgi:hypothetical protein
MPQGFAIARGFQPQGYVIKKMNEEVIAKQGYRFRL